MDLDEIKRLAKAARQFGVKAGGAMFTIELPTKIQSTLCFMEAAKGKAMDGAAMIRFQRALLLNCIVGWSGVTVKDVLPEQSPDPFEFSPDAVETLMDANPAWEETLSLELMDRLQKRKAIGDTAEKN